MSGLTSSVRTWLVIGSRQAFGLMVGISISLLLWWAYVALKGATVAGALRREVEDALGVLQGFIAIGVTVGGVVGFLYGLVAARGRQRGAAE